MKLVIKNKVQSLLLFSILALSASQMEAKDKVIVYPNAASPLFSIEVPGNWTMTEAKAADQFFLVSGPAGVQMWFRARPIASEAEFEGAIEAATASGKEWFAESYTNILLEKAIIGERDGMPFVSIKGAGVSKANGESVNFTIAFASMPNGALAQLWSIIPAKNSKGVKYFEKVLESFQPL
ncbi:MAG: hypothetical protein P1U87_15890 [Verrucomicrobiales bacterium]|nr:hypothetical protein [Verrucomicrobiales bacterium]